MKSLKMTRRPSERLAALCAEHGDAYKRVLLDEVGAPMRAFLEAKKLVEHDGTHWTVTQAPAPVVDAENAEVADVSSQGAKAKAPVFLIILILCVIAV